ncbi:antitoxin [Bdellovibrionota bacterium FG-2]
MPSLDAYNSCMTSRHKFQYTIRNVPPLLDRALRQKATRTQKSLNEVALEALAQGAGVAEEVKKYRDLDHFFGSWVHDDAIETALVEQRKIDKGLWK